MRPDRLRVALLVAILGVVTVIASGTLLAVLFRSTVELQRAALVDLVAAREALIDAAYVETGSEDETLRILTAAQREAPRIGATGEFTVAVRADDAIRFLVQRRYPGAATVESGAGLAEPMARALAGEHGTLIGRDYRGTKVLAAYRNVDGLGWGLVAKIDLAEIRAPFLNATAVAGTTSLLLIALGALLFTRVTSPMIASLEASEVRFRTAFEQAAVGMAHVAPDGSWLRVNQRLCEIVGYSSDELRALTFQDITHPDDLGEDVALVDRVVAGEIDSYRLEKRYIRKDGGTVWIRLTVSLVRDDHGEPSYFVSIVEDISDRVEREEALRERVKELRCLYGVSAQLEDETRPLGDILEAIPPLISAGWLYPEITTARVVVDDRESASTGFTETPWRQSANIIVAGETRGRIDVCLTSERPEADEGPFLKEERALLDDIAERLGQEVGRREARALTAESEARFRAVFERSTVGKSLTAPDGRLLEVNAAFASMLGYAVNEMRELDFARLTHPDDVPASRECVRCLLAGERSTYRMEKRYLARDGREVWADVSTTLLRNEAGEPRYFITVIVDIDDKVRAQRALLAEKAFSEAMLTSLPGVAYLFGEDLRFRRWNENFERVTGYSSDEFAALSPLDLFPEGEKERVAERIGEVFTTGESSVEASLLARDGGAVPFLFTGHLVEIDGASFLVGVGIDISARKRAEAELAAVNAELEERVARRTRELRSAHERLSFVIGATPAVIYARKAEGDRVVTFVTDNVDELLGHEPAAFTSSASFWLEHVHPDDRERVRRGLSAVLDEGRHAHEYRFLHVDGSYRWMRDEARLVCDEDGRPAEMVGAWIDITERRENEARIEHLNQELGRTVEKLTAANRELESFSYTVSHDLRAPLRAIDGFSRILVEEHAESLEGDARRYLSIVRDNTRTMGQLIDDLLAFSRISRQEMRREPVDVDDLVDEVWRELESDREGRRVEFHRAPLPRVSGDPRLLKLVFANLLGNAVKFTRKQEVARIEIGTRRNGEAKVVYVSDNGDGFDMRYVDKLFGVFQRLHKAADFEGTGVGLATVARIVHRHGGRVWAEGEPGRGATFFLTLQGGDDDGADQPG